MNKIKQVFGIDAVLVRQIGGFLVADVDATDDAVLIRLATTSGATSYNGAAGNTAIPASAGTAFLTKASAGAYTLPAPTVDGVTVSFISTTAFAHTVTAGAGKINGAASGIATFGAAIGNSMVLESFGGVWYTKGSPLNVTIT